MDEKDAIIINNAPVLAEMVRIPPATPRPIRRDANGRLLPGTGGLYDTDHARFLKIIHKCTKNKDIVAFWNMIKQEAIVNHNMSAATIFIDRILGKPKEYIEQITNLTVMQSVARDTSMDVSLEEVDILLKESY